MAVLYVHRCCKFAEGDSRILQMKLMRGRLAELKRASPLQLAAGMLEPETRAAVSLAKKLMAARSDPVKMDKAMMDNWKEIYGLSEMVEERILETTPRKAFIEGDAVERIWPADPSFDQDWVSKLKQVAQGPREAQGLTGSPVPTGAAAR